MISSLVMNNPFQILTFIVAPAILTNSSAVLSLSTSNRFARTVDRSRILYDKLKHHEQLTSEEKALYKQQLRLIGQRSLLLVRALTWFYVSVGSFAATTLISLLGAGVSFLHFELVSDIAVGGMLCCGLLGVLGLVTGTALLVQEMWRAQTFLRAEVQLTENLYQTITGPSERVAIESQGSTEK